MEKEIKKALAKEIASNSVYAKRLEKLLTLEQLKRVVVGTIVSVEIIDHDGLVKEFGYQNDSSSYSHGTGSTFKVIGFDSETHTVTLSRTYSIIVYTVEKTGRFTKKDNIAYSHTYNEEYKHATMLSKYQEIPVDLNDPNFAKYFKVTIE